MSQVYLAYKREDEARVARLAGALSLAGVDVWWDRELPGGESWREHLETRLAEAGCVVAVWTQASTGPDGRFVRDEASRGMARDILVPVLLDRVQAPLGFGDIQAIDLTRWRGNPRDPFFRDLVAAIQAKLDGRPTPPPRGPVIRLTRQLVYGTLSTAGLATIASFCFNIFGTASRICTIPGPQPALSDSCGMLGLGERPSRAERLAWQALPPGNCGALRTFVQHFPQGVHRGEAADLITARRLHSEERWVPVTRPLPQYVPADGPATPSEAAAKASAIARAMPDAERLCRGFGAGTLFRFVSATSTAESWSCSNTAGGIACGFDGQAQCRLQQRVTIEREYCGDSAGATPS